MTAATFQQLLFPGAFLSHDDECVRLRFEQPRQALSSAVLNGGVCLADQFVNLKVGGDCPFQEDNLNRHGPADTLQRYCEQQNWHGMAVGMMTAASMQSLRVKQQSIEGVTVAVLVTTGISNARRAGDRAEYRQLDAQPEKPGTINLAICVETALRSEAMVELITVATEAKAAALQQLAVISPVSGQIATGTGTDATAIFCHPVQQQGIRFAGKHTLLGETVAQLVIKAISESLAWDKSVTLPQQKEVHCATVGQ